MDSNQGEPLVRLGLWDRFARGMTTNVAVLDDRDADPRLRPWHCPLPPEMVVRHVANWVQSDPQWDFRDDPPAPHDTEIHLVRRTAILRFVDDVTVTLSPEKIDAADPADSADSGSPGTLVHARSQSRIGKGDLGQNRRNLTALRTALPA